MLHKLNVPIYMMVSFVHLQVHRLSPFWRLNKTLIQDPQGKGCNIVSTKDDDYKVIEKARKPEEGCLNDIGKTLNQKKWTNEINFSQPINPLTDGIQIMAVLMGGGIECTCISCVYMCISRAYTCNTPGNGLVVFAIPKNPHFDPLTHLSVTIQSKVTIREILSLKPREYTWNTYVSHLEIV